jgi:hypothetical protein
MNTLPSGGDELVRRFEAEWEEGKKPNLSDFLPRFDSAGAMALVLRLIEIDLLRRIEDGETASVVERYFHLPGFTLSEEQKSALQAKEERLRQTLPPDFAEPFQNLPSRERVGDTNRRRRQLAAFNIEGLPVLGSGGMGVVYRLKDADLDREVAVKIILPNLYPHGCGRFENEARILARLEHPGVVPIHVIGNYLDGRPFFTMKIVEGQTLEKLLDARPSPAENVTRYLDIFEQVCQTVAFAHAKNILHRDLKPGNVMVGAFGEVQVMDWGLGKLLDTEAPRVDAGDETAAPDEHATAPGHAMGTCAYAAPEQMRGHVERISTRSDVFGLGAILCEILTGSPPYTPPNRIEKARDADLTEAWARLAACGADPELKEIVRKCLAPEPEARFADAGEVARRLADYRAASQQRLDAARLDTEKATARLAAEHKALDAEKRRSRIARWALGLGLALAVGAIVSAWVIYNASKETADAVRRAARLAFGQGQALCEKGDIPRGLFWFVRSLELDPNDEELQDAARRQISVWRTQIPTLSKTWKELSPVRAADFHPSGKSFFLRFKDGSIAAYGLEDNEKLWSHTKSDPEQPWFLAPTGASLVTVRKGSTLQVIDTANGKLLHEQPTEGRVLAVAFLKDQPAPRVAVRKSGQVWVSEGAKSTQWPTEDEPITAAFDLSGQYLLIRSEKGLVCWHLPSTQINVQVPDRSVFKSLEKIDANELEPTMRRLAALSAPIKDAAISPNGKRIVAARADHRIQLWNTGSGAPVFAFDDPSSTHENVSKVVFDASSSLVITGNHESLVVWKSTGEKVNTLELPRKITAPFGFLATREAESSIIYAQGEKDGFRLARVSDHAAEWFSVTFAGQPLAVHTEGKLVLVGDEQGTCYLWEIGGRLAPKWLPNLANVHAATYAEDGASARIVFRKEERGQVSFTEQTWDLTTLVALSDKTHIGDGKNPAHQKVEAHTSDGRWSATGTGDRSGELIFHDRSLQCRIGPVVSCGAVNSIGFHPDKRKRQVIIVGADGRLATLELPMPRTETPAEIRRDLERILGSLMDEAGNLVDLAPAEWEARKRVEKGI